MQSLSTVKVNWVDGRRGTTTFPLVVGKDINQADFEKHHDGGELYVNVFYSDPGSPYVHQTYPDPCFVSKQTYERDVDELYKDFQRTFIADIVCRPASGKSTSPQFTWPGSDKLCWGASSSAR